jgi:hypothetical protein
MRFDNAAKLHFNLSTHGSIDLQAAIGDFATWKTGT